jgi:hypothetical protein
VNEVSLDIKNTPENAEKLPLCGCTVAVSSRLWHRRDQFKHQVASLGGSFVYTLDKHCTHLLHLGAVRSDTLKDVEGALQWHVHIVAPTWLEACANESKRCDEAAHPYFSSQTGSRNDLPKEISQISPLIFLSTQRDTSYSLSNSNALEPAIVTPSLTSTSLPMWLGEESAVKKPNLPFFCFTGLTEAEKRKGSRIVEELGGGQAPLDNPSWDHRTTHLISGRPSRSEKFLAAIASGAWILDLSYLEECLVSGRFLEEHRFEVASCEEEAKVKRDLADAARFWRQTLNVDGRRSGAFTSWKVVLVCEEKRREGFIRLLEAGGAHVYTPEDVLLPDPLTVTHLFFSSSAMRSRLKADWVVHVDEGKIFGTEYIADFLLKR